MAPATVIAEAPDEAGAIEEIDIGGVALLRGAAKNFAHVIVAHDPGQYAGILDALAGEFQNELLNQALRKNIGASNARIREFIMAKAFFSVDAPSTIAKLLAELDAEEMKDAELEIPVPWATNG